MHSWTGCVRAISRYRAAGTTVAYFVKPKHPDFMQSAQPTVTVVMATYNGARFLREQIESILAQTYPVEALVIQDGRIG